MRILHVITDLDVGGAETMLLRLLACRDDWDPLVLSVQESGPLGQRIADLGVPVRSLGVRRSRPNPLRALAIRGIARNFRPQIVQGWMYHGNLAASLAGTFLPGRVPVIWNIRQSLYDMRKERRLTAAFIRLGARLSRRTAAIVYNSRIGAQQHEAVGYSAARRVIIPNGFDCSSFRPDEEARRQVRAELRVEPDESLIGLVARFHPMKDHAAFLHAASQVARQHADVRFVLVGSGTREQPELVQLIRDLQLQDRVILLGERADTSRLTAAIDIACSASAWGEGFSNAIGEAMACGVPCVVTDIGENPHLVADTGLSVPPRDPQAFGNAIHQLIEAGHAHRRQLGAAARRRIESAFSLPVVARRYDELYRAWLDNERPVSPGTLEQFLD
jgi:glycosyltransferase involved in cell wall biosynthesis